MHVTPDDVPEVVEESNAVVMRALVRTADVSLTWVRLAGRHRRLRTDRSTRVYYVLDGEAEFEVGDAPAFVARAGDAVTIDPGTAYGLEGELTYLVVNGPGFADGDDVYDD